MFRQYLSDNGCLLGWSSSEDQCLLTLTLEQSEQTSKFNLRFVLPTYTTTYLHTTYKHRGDNSPAILIVRQCISFNLTVFTTCLNNDLLT